jgi:hypothetical protein
MALKLNKSGILWVQHLKEMNDDLDWLHTHMLAHPFGQRSFSYNDEQLWHQYREDNYSLLKSCFDFWDDYQNDLNRIREEKIMELFGIGKETLKDIWPK